jgi:hypothetical protein
MDPPREGAQQQSEEELLQAAISLSLAEEAARAGEAVTLPAWFTVASTVLLGASLYTDLTSAGMEPSAL